MRVIRILLGVMAISALVWAPGAMAKQYAPPGKAGTSEYAEDIPTAGGNAATPAMGAGNKTAAEINRLGQGKAGVRKLAKLGKTGAAAAQFAQQTAPVRITASPTSPTKPGAAVAAPKSTLTAADGSALSGLGHLIGGSDVDGIGVFLPLFLLLGIVAAAVVGVLRLRRPDTPNS